MEQVGQIRKVSRPIHVWAKIFLFGLGRFYKFVVAGSSLKSTNLATLQSSKWVGTVAAEAGSMTSRDSLVSFSNPRTWRRLDKEQRGYDTTSAAVLVSLIAHNSTEICPSFKNVSVPLLQRQN